MNNKNGLTELKDTFNNNALPVLTDFVEVGVDQILNDGLFKDIPIVSAAVSAFKIGKSVSEYFYMKKMNIFVEEVNKNIIDSERIEEYKRKIISDQKRLDRDIKFIIAIIDKYMGLFKPKLLARLFLSYLDKSMGQEQFFEYSEIIDRLLISDLKCLYYFLTNTGIVKNENTVEIASVLRLQSVGFVERNNQLTWGSFDSEHNTEFDYVITDSGIKLATLLEKELEEIITEDLFA